MYLDDLAVELHRSAKNKGFWDEYRESNSTEFICMKLALIHSEVTEVLEAIRKSKSEEEVLDEFVDIIIRTLDLYAGMNERWFSTNKSIDVALNRKRQVNSERPRLHGNKF